jgi:hypothetical protein
MDKLQVKSEASKQGGKDLKNEVKKLKNKFENSIKG